jgi:hypothetical protein
MTFDVTVVTPRRGPGALVVLPDEAATVFGTRARVGVRATFNGVSYQGSAMPMGEGRFGLGLTKAIRSEAGVAIGDTVHVVVERDTAPRTVDVPDDLMAALQSAGLADRFAALAHTHRREYVAWVSEAARAETRARRVAKAVARVGEGRARS